MLALDQLKFDENDLIPAIVKDFYTKKVLTLAYMNHESLRISLEKKLTCFYSRSRQKLWLKGETSGNFQHIQSITADCDRDALVIEVIRTAPPAIRAAIPALQTRCWARRRMRIFPLPTSMRCCKAANRRCPKAPTPPICLKKEWIKS